MPARPITAYKLALDGAVQVLQPPAEARSVEIANGSSVALTMTEDNGSAWAIPPGQVVVLPVEPGTTFRFQSASAALGPTDTAKVWFFNYYRQSSGTLQAAGGGAGGVVTLGAGTANVGSVNLPGPANFATGQVALNAVTATQVVAGRPTRYNALIRNPDTAINVWVGTVTVAAGSGMLLKPGDAITIEAQAAVWAIAASGTPSVAFADEWY